MNMIAENIARRRKELGLTQKELAEKLNVSDKTLSRWETDKQVPDALMIPEIAKALDMSIGEIYGVSDASDKKKDVQKKEATEENSFEKEVIDYARINTYKIVLFAGVFLIVLGSGIYSFMGVLWNYMKIGALILLFVGLATFFIGELTFEEFYQRKDDPHVYQKIHKQWFGIAIPLAGLILGIVIPAVKTPIVTVFNNWDAILPLLLFQGCVLILYRRDEKERTKLHYTFLAVGIICVIGFLINAMNNPYRYMGGFTYNEWALKEIWIKIKIFELSSGLVLFFINVLHSKDVLGIYGKTIRKTAKLSGIMILVASVVAVVCVHVTNKNLQSRITYTSGEVPMYQLTNYSYELIDWIQECNLSGEEICMKKSSVYRGIGEQADAYLIYLPHGYEKTELKVQYQVGLGKKILKINAGNTTQIVDDNYYLCYMEVMNYGEDYEIQTYLDGEHTTYMKLSTTSIWNVFE